MTLLRSGSATDVGRVRNTNQDVALEGDNLFAVADGMGGHAGGEVAAQVALQTLQNAFGRQPTVEGLRHAVSEANDAVFHQGQLRDDLRGMGTTLTAAGLVAGADGRDVIALANVGDSRAYVFSGGRLSQVTTDHSLAEEKVRHGQLTEAEAAVHPHRHILTRALGIGSAVVVDLWELRLRSGDRLLICSDGLTNEVGINQITEVLGSVHDPSEAARVLVQTANEHGGSDNITVVVVDVLLGEQGKGSDVTVVTPVAAPGPAVVVAADPSPDAIDPGDAAPLGRPAPPPPPPVPPEPPVVRPGDAPLGAGLGPYPPGDVTGVVQAYSGPSAEDLFIGGAAAATGVVVAEPALEAIDLPPPPEIHPPPPAPRETRGERRRRLGIPRRVTFRVLGFFLLVAAVVAGAYVFVRWYAMDNWYVTVRGGQLVVYQGQQGGLLWFKPKLVDKTGVTTAEVLPIHLAALQAGVDKSSLAEAKTYVTGLEQEFIAQQQLGLGPAGNGGGVGPTGTLPTLPPPTTTPPPPPPGAKPAPTTAPAAHAPSTTTPGVPISTTPTTTATTVPVPTTAASPTSPALARGAPEATVPPQ